MKIIQTAAAATLALAILVATTTAQTPDSTSAYWTTGIRFNQGKPFGLLGVTKRLSSRMYLYTGADLGGYERSITTQPALRITRPAKIELYALLGPQIETVEPNPDSDQTIDYMTLSSGALISYQRNKDLSIFAGIAYLWTDADIHKWKFGLGLLLPLDLGQ